MWYLPTVGISLIIAVIICRHSRDVHAVCTTVKGCNIRCRRMSLETRLETSCSADVHRNGVALNGTVAINSVEDYGVYSCCSGDGIVYYYVMPHDCEGEHMMI